MSHARHMSNHMYIPPHAVPKEPIPSGSITAQRTADNTLIVVQWRPFTPTNQSSFPVAGYQVEFRHAGMSGSGERVQPAGLIAVRNVSDADSYEVRRQTYICVCCVM